MICSRCGNEYEFYSPPHEPPENHYMHCRRCDRTVWLGPDEEER